MKLPKRSIVIDISNILFRVSATQTHNNPYNKDLTPEDLVGLCMHISMQSTMRWFNKFKPDFVVFAFDGANNWRKDYTARVKSRRAYKGNRVIDPAMQHFYTLIPAFRDMMTAHTSVCCLSVDTMEADDAIAAYCQIYASPESEIYIISGDKDFTQLLKLPGVKLINPDNGKARNSPGDKDYQSDIDYWMFLKCVRGDGGDNVPSAFPRVRETRIKKAYSDSYERINFMNETWVDENEVKRRVGDLYEENVTLMDLEKQPSEIRIKLLTEVADQVQNFGSYSHFHFLRFLESFNLSRIREDAMKFVEMLSNNQIKKKLVTLPVDKPTQVEVPVDKSPNLLQF